MLKCQYGQISHFSEHCWKDLLFTASTSAALPPADGTLLFQLTFLKSSPRGPEPAGLGKDGDPLLTHSSRWEWTVAKLFCTNTPSVRLGLVQFPQYAWHGATCQRLKTNNVTFKWRTARYSSWQGHAAANGAGMAPNLPDTWWNWDWREGRTCCGNPACWHWEPALE